MSDNVTVLEKNRFGNKLPTSAGSNDDKYALEGIIGEKKAGRGKTRKTLYECKWLGYTETTFEPRANLPRICFERYKQFGKDSVATFISKTVHYDGMDYINVKWVSQEGQEACDWMPHRSLEADVNAYKIKMTKTLKEQLEQAALKETVDNSDIERSLECNTR